MVILRLWAGLIETWDVLKHVMNYHNLTYPEINRNMGCIETKENTVINITKPRLIETWDVLKLAMGISASTDETRLIETWDVLKRISFYTMRV